MSKTTKGNVLEFRAVTSLSPTPDTSIPAVNIMHELSSLTMLEGLYACNIQSEAFLVFIIKELNFVGK
jgi:hypothetical protein